WGILSEIKYLPRVTYKNLILHEAQWQLNAEDFNLPIEKGTSCLKHFSEIKSKFDMPDKIFYSDGDWQLLVDFNDELSLHALKRYIKPNKKIIFKEFLASQNNSVITDQEGKCYTNQIIFPLYTNS